MNRSQKIAIVVGALVIAGLALFPPWGESSPEFAWFRDAPSYTTSSGRGRRSSVRVAQTKNASLLDQLQGAALVLTVAAVLVLKDKKV